MSSEPPPTSAGPLSVTVLPTPPTKSMPTPALLHIPLQTQVSALSESKAIYHCIPCLASHSIVNLFLKIHDPVFRSSSLTTPVH